MKAAWLLLGRVLVVLGASAIIAGIIGAYVGPKPLTTFQGSLPVKPGEVVGLLAWAQTASGKVELHVNGSGGLYYAKLRGDPLSYLTNATAFGVRVGEVEARKDVRGGVFMAAAKLRVDAFTLYFALKRLNSTQGSSLIENLTLGESLVVVVLPANTSQPIIYTLEFRSTNVPRTSLPSLEAAGAALGVSGLALMATAKVKTRPKTPAA